MTFTEKYVNPFTDYGFKRLFGEEPNKELLKDFLNELLADEFVTNGQGKIVELTYLNGENLGISKEERKSFFDVYCTNEKGDKFIVELQKSKQIHFKDRTLYYSTFPIIEQSKRGSDWNFELSPVYTIAILDFVFDDDEGSEKYLYNVKLTEQETQTVFYDKLTFIYLAMPNFKKQLHELETRFDKWLYVLKNLHRLQEIPNELQENTFLKLFDCAEVAQFSTSEYLNYEASLQEYRDIKNMMETSHIEGVEEGFVKGRLQEKLEIAKNMKKLKLNNADIATVTGLTIEEIEKL